MLNMKALTVFRISFDQTSLVRPSSAAKPRTPIVHTEVQVYRADGSGADGARRHEMPCLFPYSCDILFALTKKLRNRCVIHLVEVDVV